MAVRFISCRFASKLASEVRTRLGLSVVSRLASAQLGEGTGSLVYSWARQKRSCLQQTFFMFILCREEYNFFFRLNYMVFFDKMDTVEMMWKPCFY